MQSIESKSLCLASNHAAHNTIDIKYSCVTHTAVGQADQKLKLQLQLQLPLQAIALRLARQRHPAVASTHTLILDRVRWHLTRHITTRSGSARTVHCSDSIDRSSGSVFKLVCSVAQPTANSLHSPAYCHAHLSLDRSFTRPHAVAVRDDIFTLFI